ncbi:hypothetical protein [Salinibacter ruber]|uniref:hypothetical protein n=1 Tax=Salinibacter ruber TaxID=146919 RepID=UPI00216853B6|nr:hypothetical protein [Salinibacter ruber]MCS4102362.1 hypothetical protein [Salinibacter ruber]
MNKLRKISDLYDTAKALSHCEMCLEAISRDKITDHQYEFFYNSLVYYIDQAWDLAESHFSDLRSQYNLVDKIVEDIYDDRHGDDDLIHYMRHARNQLTHEEMILTYSDEINESLNLGKPVEVYPHQFSKDTDLHSTIVMPSFRMSFGNTHIYSRRVTGHKDGITVEVPKKHDGKEIERTPTNMANLTYDYYGSRIRRMHNKVRRD